MFKKGLTKNIVKTFLGSSIILAPVFTYLSISNTNQISLINATKDSSNDNIANLNEHGIVLSKYEVEGWQGTTETIQVLNNNTPVTDNVTWDIEDTSKIEISKDGNNFKVNFKESYSESGKNEIKLKATYIDSEGSHTSTCVARILNPFAFKASSYSQSVKATTGTTKPLTFTFDWNSNVESETDLRLEPSEYAYDLSQWAITHDSEKRKTELKVGSKTSLKTGRVEFSLYNEKDTNKTKTTVLVYVVNNVLSFDNNNVSTRIGDSPISITPRFNGTEVSDPNLIQWGISDPTACSLQKTSTGKVNLLVNKVTSEPVIISCRETDPAESVNTIYCYLNITNSHFAISDKSKTSFKLTDGSIQLNSTLDGVDKTSSTKWSSSATDICIVDSTTKGKAKFLRPGNVTITASYQTDAGVVLTDSYSFTIESINIKTNPSEISALIGSEPQTIQVLIDDQPITDPEKKLIFKSTNEEVATVDSKGTVTFKGIGTAEIECIPVDYIQQGIKAVTKVTAASPSEDVKIEFTEKSYGTEDGEPHKLPQATMGGVKIPFSKDQWKAPEGVTIRDDGTIDCDKPGDYKLTYTVTVGGKTYTQEVTIHIREFFCNDFMDSNPTVYAEATTPTMKRGMKVEFWFDAEHTKKIQIKSLVSSNTARAVIEDGDYVKYVGHGWVDITCQLIYEHGNETRIKTSVMHIHINVWWWAWFAVALALAIIIAAIIINGVIRHKRKLKKIEENKSSKK